MKIAINARYLTLPYSGIGQYTFNLLSSLAEVDKVNEYFLFVPWPVDTNFGPNFHIVDIREPKLFSIDFLMRSWWEQVQLSNALRRMKPDLYHSLYQTMPIGSQKFPSIVTVHDAIPWRFPFQRKDPLYRWYSDMSRNSCQRAYKAFAVSETAKSDLSLVYGLRPENVIVTYQTVNELYFQNDASSERIRSVKKKFGLTKPFLLYSGGFKRHKNVRFMIKAFAYAVQKYHLDIDLVIPGKIRTHSGLAKDIYFDPSGLQRYAEQKGLKKRAKFIGHVGSHDLAILYRIARAFISLSLYEGFGLPPLEAMASGTPVIVSNTAAYPEIIDGGGVLVYPHGTHRVADAINQLFTNKTFHHQMVAKGKKRVEFFDRAKIAHHVLQLYNEIRDGWTSRSH